MESVSNLLIKLCLGNGSGKATGAASMGCFVPHVTRSCSDHGGSGSSLIRHSFSSVPPTVKKLFPKKRIISAKELLLQNEVNFALFFPLGTGH